MSCTSHYFTWECPRKVLTYFNLQAFKWIIILSLPNCQLETVMTATFIIIKGWLWELLHFFWARKKKIIGKKWESQERETLQKLLASVVGAEEILKSRSLQWTVGSPACLVSPCPLHTTLVPPHRSALHIHTHFPWAQVGEPESDPRAELAERFMSSRGACRGRWHWSCDDLRAPHIILPYQASLCPMEPVAQSQEWLWLSFGGEMGLFWKWKVIQHYPNVSWGWEVRQAPPGKPHLGKVSPAWLDKHEKNGKQRQAGMESPLRTSSHPILCIGFITS